MFQLSYSVKNPLTSKQYLSALHKEGALPQQQKIFVNYRQTPGKKACIESIKLNALFTHFFKL